jgi:gas vesicle protein
MNNKNDNLNQDNGMSTKDFVVGAIVGGLVGAATALFLAPKSGKELRNDLTEQGNALMEKGAPLMEKGTALKQTATEKGIAIKQTATEKGIALKQTATEKGTEWISVAKEKGAPITEAVKKKFGNTTNEDNDSQSSDAEANPTDKTGESNVVVDSPDDVYVGEETVDSKNTAKEETYASEKTGFNSTASGNTSSGKTPSDSSNNTVKVNVGSNSTKLNGNKGNTPSNSKNNTNKK